VLHEALDAAALARGVATFEQHDEPLLRLLDPALRLQELDLQQPLRLLVLLATQALVVGIALAPRLHRQAVGADEHGIIDRIEGPPDRQATVEQLGRGQLAQRSDRIRQIDDMVAHSFDGGRRPVRTDDIGVNDT
jgi:hypothetical protein